MNASNSCHNWCMLCELCLFSFLWKWVLVHSSRFPNLVCRSRSPEYAKTRAKCVQVCVCVCLCEYNKQISGKDKQDKHIYEVFSYVRQLVPRFPLGHINVIVVQLIRRHIERNIHFRI